jgi:hypothetical protein
MAPMKLYGAVMSWNVTRCATALEEAGSDYEIVPINFATAEHKSPEHLVRNVPYLPDPPSPVVVVVVCLFFPVIEMQRPFRSRDGGGAAVGLSSTADLTPL